MNKSMKTKLSLLTIGSAMSLAGLVGLGMEEAKNNIEAKATSHSITYNIDSKTSVDYDKSDAPSNSAATYATTYSAKWQLTATNSMTLTLSGFENTKITGLSLSMRSNTSSGAGTYYIKAGETTLGAITEDTAFNNEKWNGAYSTDYVDVLMDLDVDDYYIQEGENIVINIAATVSSLYCKAITLNYEEGPVYTYSFDFTKAITGWPDINSTEYQTCQYKTTGNNFSFDLKNTKMNSGYLFASYPAFIGLPTVEGKKLVKIVLNNSTNCAVSTKVGVSASLDSTTPIAGGQAQTLATKGSSYEYNLTETLDNTQYFFFVTSANAQIISLELTYAAEDTVESLSFSENSATCYLGEDFVKPAVIAHYRFSGESVVEASWTEINKYTLGTQIVTASFGGASATFPVTVIAKSYPTTTTTYTYVKVTEPLSNWCGDYAFVYTDENGKSVAFNTSEYVLYKKDNFIDVNIVDNSFSLEEGDTKYNIHIEYKDESQNIYSAKASNGKYIAGTTINAKVATMITEKDTCDDLAIQFTDDLVMQSISSDGIVDFKFNISSNTTKFTFTKSTSGYRKADIYKLTEIITPIENPEKHPIRITSCEPVDKIDFIANQQVNIDDFKISVQFDTNEVIENLKPTSVYPSIYSAGASEYIFTYTVAGDTVSYRKILTASAPSSIVVKVNYNAYNIGDSVEEALTRDIVVWHDKDALRYGDFEASGFDTSTTGIKDVTITHDGDSASFKIIVLSQDDKTGFSYNDITINPENTLCADLYSNWFIEMPDYHFTKNGENFVFNHSSFTFQLDNPDFRTPWGLYNQNPRPDWYAFDGDLCIRKEPNQIIPVAELNGFKYILDYYGDGEGRDASLPLAETFIDLDHKDPSTFTYSDQNGLQPVLEVYKHNYTTGENTNISNQVTWDYDKFSSTVDVTCYYNNETVSHRIRDVRLIKETQVLGTANLLKDNDVRLEDVIYIAYDDGNISGAAGYISLTTGSAFVPATLTNDTLEFTNKTHGLLIESYDENTRTFGIYDLIAGESFPGAWSISVDADFNATIVGTIEGYGQFQLVVNDANEGRFILVPNGTTGYKLPKVYLELGPNHQPVVEKFVNKLTNNYIYTGDTVYVGYKDSNVSVAAEYFVFGSSMQGAPAYETTIENNKMNVGSSVEGLILSEYHENTDSYKLTSNINPNINILGDWTIKIDNNGDAIITSPHPQYGSAVTIQIYYNIASGEFLITQAGLESDTLKRPQAFIERTHESLAKEFIYEYLKFGSYDSSYAGNGECSTEGYYNAAKAQLGVVISKLTNSEIQAYLLSNNEALGRLFAWADYHGEMLDLKSGQFVKKASGKVSNIFGEDSLINTVATPKGLYLSLTIGGILLGAIGCLGGKFKRKED